MKKNKIAAFFINMLYYIGGLALIALGANISKLSCLGISPASSVPRAVEVVCSNAGIKFVSLGVATYTYYLILILLQVIILRKRFKPINLLGIPISVIFGYMVDFFGTNPDKFGHLLYGFYKPSTYIGQLLYIPLYIVIIGAGVYLYLQPKWIPLPAEGLAEAVSITTGKNFGNCKTYVDCAAIGIALIIQFIFLGGFKSFTGDTIVVREGTIISAIMVGQVVKPLMKAKQKRLKKRQDNNL